jgi:hypothetical protein
VRVEAIVKEDNPTLIVLSALEGDMTITALKRSRRLLIEWQGINK